MKPRAPVDRRQQDRRRAQERRELRMDALRAELQPLQANVKGIANKILELEDAQHVQLVRISQIQQEIDELKKTRAR